MESVAGRGWPRVAIVGGLELGLLGLGVGGGNDEVKGMDFSLKEPRSGFVAFKSHRTHIWDNVLLDLENENRERERETPKGSLVFFSLFSYFFKKCIKLELVKENCLLILV